MERSTLNSEPTNLCRYYCWQAGALWICNYRQTDPVTIWTSQIHFRETHSSSMELETEELCARFTGGWKNWKHLVQYYRDLVHFSRRGNLRIQIVSPMFLTFTFPPFWNGKGRRKEKGTGTMQRHSPCQSHAGLFFFSELSFSLADGPTSSKIPPLRAAGLQHLLTEYFRTIIKCYVPFNFLST